MKLLIFLIVQEKTKITLRFTFLQHKYTDHAISIVVVTVTGPFIISKRY